MKLAPSILSFSSSRRVFTCGERLSLCVVVRAYRRQFPNNSLLGAVLLSALFVAKKEKGERGQTGGCIRMVLAVSGELVILGGGRKRPCPSSGLRPACKWAPPKASNLSCCIGDTPMRMPTAAHDAHNSSSNLRFDPFSAPLRCCSGHSPWPPAT